MPEFFDVSDVLDFHFEQIELYGGSHGVRDMGMLESALAMPMSGFDGNYLYLFPFEMAAAYLFHIVQNHPFIDGNKRTGLAACLYFLGLHGIEVVADPDGLASLVLSVAEGNLDKPQIAAFLKEHSGKTG
ncbi:MAG: type II toxin-antitoxin system death-on-curing family toxin [Synergistaceae bacterium]|jgi:death-on-curing protein|nr:type II toxin-antitoxin system death-on-curing family toxin [Synergistaceae bacterium]